MIAAVSIGREARRLDAVAPRAVYMLDDAVAFVAARLPAESQARLTFDEVQRLLVAHMRWLHAKGLQPRDVIDRPQDIEEELVVNEDTITAWLLGEAERLQIELLDDVDAVRVVQAHLAYFDEIGAVGPRASS
ncbi:MAG: hypothetical protein JHC86_07125 [Ilumatobacteraceae bacterium]|nr:hypothetical protein [Ilumatobacteraceae bacterium]